MSHKTNVDIVNAEEAGLRQSADFLEQHWDECDPAYLSAVAQSMRHAADLLAQFPYLMGLAENEHRQCAKERDEAQQAVLQRLTEELQTAKEELAQWQEQVERLTAERNSMELRYRTKLWLGHGHVGQYGDDGEMQCSACAPFGNWDYRRAPLAELEATLELVAIDRLRPRPEGST